MSEEMAQVTAEAPSMRGPGRPPIRRVRLLWTLLAAMLLASLLPLFLTAWKLIDINRESLEAASREYQLQVASGVVQQLDSVAAGSRHQLSAIAIYLGSLLDQTPTNSPYWQGLLQPHLKGNLIHLRYAGSAGVAVETGPSDVAREPAMAQELFEGFATAIGGEDFVGRPVRSAARVGRPHFAAAVPVRTRAGAVIGVLSAVIDLGGAWESAIKSLSEQYIVFALDDTLALFADAAMPEALRQGDAWKKLEIVARFQHSGGGVIEIIPFEAPPGLQARELLGARAATERGWGIFVLVDRGLAYASAAEMRRSVLQWALFAVVLALAVAGFLAGAITRPLKALVERTRRIAAGDFSTQAELKSRNELGELAETFNFMSEEIRNYISRIKQAADENNHLFLGTIRALAAAIDEKDPYTRGHSERVHRYSVAIARRLGVSRQEMRNITVGSLLHDVGKIGIEDAILRKPAALSDKEFEIMKRHPLKGAHILEDMPQMKEIIPAMRNHHERWSGGGYPDNLRGEEIPMIARIVQVADAFDAMTTNRPYQRAMRMDAGVARVVELSGIVFDPRVVVAFKEAWVAGDLKDLTEEARPLASPAVEPPAAGPSTATVGSVAAIVTAGPGQAG